MKIITVNIPDTYLQIIDKFVGENNIYPSRSELVRASVREFLKEEMAQNFEMYSSEFSFDKAVYGDAKDPYIEQDPSKVVVGNQTFRIIEKKA